MHIRLTCRQSGAKVLYPAGMLYVEAGPDGTVRAAALGLAGHFEAGAHGGYAEPRMVDVAEPLWEIEAMLDRAKTCGHAKGVVAGADVGAIPPRPRPSTRSGADET